MKTINHFSRHILALTLCFFVMSSASFGVEFTGKVTTVENFDAWKVMEFADSQEIWYRLVTTSINANDVNIVFDFMPTRNCVSVPAVMIIEFKTHKKSLNEGVLLMEYKIPGETEGYIELVKTYMPKGDRFVSVIFEKLIPERIYLAEDKGKLAIWVSESKLAKINQSNMYFSLNGFMQAYERVHSLCSHNL